MFLNKTQAPILNTIIREEILLTLPGLVSELSVLQIMLHASF